MKSICIVGYGSIGKRHHRVLLNIFGTEASFDIVDLHTQKKLKDCVNKKYDILVICTPSSSHIEILDKFKNVSDLVFIEKPLDSSFEAAKLSSSHLIDKVHVGCNLRFTESYRMISEIIDDALFISVNTMSYLPSWRKIKDYKKNYSANKCMGGGVVLDFIHEPDYIFSLLGIPKSFKNLERRLFDEITVDSSDTASLLWEYEDKIVNINMSYGSKDYIRSFVCLLKNGETKQIDFKTEDIEKSYEAQWVHIIKNGPCNSYNDALKLLEILHEDT